MQQSARPPKLLAPMLILAPFTLRGRDEVQTVPGWDGTTGHPRVTNGVAARPSTVKQDPWKFTSSAIKILRRNRRSRGIAEELAAFAVGSRV